MSKGLNRGQIIGFLGHDPDLNRTGDGTAVVNLRIATDESYTDRDGTHRRRREAGDEDDAPDGRAVADALYGGLTDHEPDSEADER